MYAHTMENKWEVSRIPNTWASEAPWLAYWESNGEEWIYRSFKTWQEAFDYAFNRAISDYLAADEQSPTELPQGHTRGQRIDPRGGTA